MPTFSGNIKGGVKLLPHTACCAILYFSSKNALNPLYAM